MKKYILVWLSILSLIFLIITIIQIWSSIFNEEIFAKIIITYIIICAILWIIYWILSQKDEDDNLKKGKYLA